MALKPDRQIDSVDISFFCDEVADRGVVVSINTAGSGIAMDSTRNVVTVAANSSGQKPLGLLLNDFVNIDRTRVPLNWHKDQAASGDKATVLTDGWVVTNKITGTPTAGQLAVLSSSGTVAGQNRDEVGWRKDINPFVGYFITSKDQDGYAKISVEL